MDDGTYKIVDDRTFVVSKEFPDVTFHFRVTGDTIRFDPVVPSCAPGCFEAVWSVMVAFPGKTWERVSCAWGRHGLVQCCRGAVRTRHRPESRDHRELGKHPPVARQAWPPPLESRAFTVVAELL